MIFTKMLYHDTDEQNLECNICQGLRLPQDHDPSISFELPTFKVSDLTASSKNGCSGCEVLHTCVRGVQETLDPETTVFPQWKRFSTKTAVFGFAIGKKHVNDHLVVADPIDQCPWTLISKAVEQPYNRTIDTQSEISIDQINEWYKDCLESHHRCQINSDFPQLPTRVLEIQGPGTKIKLYSSHKGEMAPYVCLSHCWGKSQLIRTLLSNVNKHIEGIELNALPLTFQQAIQVTARLGLKYLWIDSLCIIQDSLEDWQREGSVMDQIYTGATLTLAAAFAKDSSEGLFNSTRPRIYTQEHLATNSRGKKYTIQTQSRNLPHPGVIVEPSPFPLLERAWVYQERLLSPRMIYFGEFELLFECHQSTKCGCSIWENQSMSMYFTTKDTLLDTTGWDDLPSRQRTAAAAQRWQTLVSEYSSKQLTMLSDVFPALQGIAQRFGREIGCAYYAGLWEDHLLSDLLWHSLSAKYSSRPPKWRAPSWSWASIYGRVFFELSDEPWEVMAKLDPKVEILSVSTTPSGISTYGELKGADLVLRGKYVCVSYLKVTENNTLRIETNERAFDLDYRPDYDYDIPGSFFIPPSTQMWVLNMAEHVLGYRYFLLLIKDEKSPDAFQRVGMVFMLEPNLDFEKYFEQFAQERVIKIV